MRADRYRRYGIDRASKRFAIHFATTICNDVFTRYVHNRFLRKFLLSRLTVHPHASLNFFIIENVEEKGEKDHEVSQSNFNRVTNRGNIFQSTGLPDQATIRMNKPTGTRRRRWKTTSRVSFFSMHAFPPKRILLIRVPFVPFHGLDFCASFFRFPLG